MVINIIFSNYYTMDTIQLMVMLACATCALMCPSVTFNGGNIVHVGSLAPCTFQLNGEDKEYTGSEIKAMRFYGYVLMSCSDCTLGLISSFTGCDDCIWCLHNEGVSNCKSIALPIIASSAITIVLTLIFILIIWRTRLVSKCMNRMESMAKTSRKSKILKRQREATKLKIYFDNQSGDDNDSNAPSVAERPLYPAIDHYIEVKDVFENEATAPTYDVPPRLPKRTSTTTFDKTKAAAGLALIMTSSLARACDVTSYVSSENKIYMDDKLTTLYSGVYHMSDKQTLCLKYEDGKVDKVVVQETHSVDTYTPIYRTANYSLHVVNAPWRCYSAGECDYGKCLDGSIYSGWKGEEVKSGQIISYGCKQGNDFCNFCSYYGQCKWYKYSLKPEGSLYTVYRKVKSDWSIMLSYISYDGTVNRMIMSSNMISMESTSGTRISLLTPTKPQYFQNNFLIESPEGSLWNVDANKRGDLSSSLIGDLQIGLFDSTEIAYQTNSVFCYSNDCLVQCKTSEPGLIRGLKQYYNYTVVADKLSYDRIVRNSVFMSFGMFVTTKKESSLVSIPASCSFELSMTYGCIACNKRTYAIIQASKIKSMGMVDIKSNCSLDRTRLACQESPQLIVIDNHNDICEVTILKSNQTLILTIDYVFEGHVYGVTGLISTTKQMSSQDLALQFLTSDNFLKSLGSMMSGVTFFGLSLLAIRSLLKYLAVRQSVATVKDIKQLT